MTPSVHYPSLPAAKDRRAPKMPSIKEPDLDEDDSLVVVYGAGEYFEGSAD